MKTQFDKLRSGPQVMLVIAVMLVSVVGLAGLADRTPQEAAGTARPRVSRSLLAAWAEPAPALAQEATPTIRSKARCAGCGTIEASSETETLGEDVGGHGTTSAPGTLSTRRWITVRFAGGSRRVIDDLSAAQWRPRERVIVIGGLAADR